MSDALTDIARDQERNERYRIFLETLANYLKDPVEKNYDLLKKAAEDVDEVRGGYWSGRTKIASNLKERTENLLNKNIEEWSKLLDSVYGTEFYKKFRSISPFKNKTLIFIEEHRAYSEGKDIRIEFFANMIEEKIKEIRPKESFYSPKYVLILPFNLKKTLEEIIKQAKVICVRK